MRVLMFFLAMCEYKKMIDEQVRYIHGRLLQHASIYKKGTKFFESKVQSLK